MTTGTSRTADHSIPSGSGIASIGNVRLPSPIPIDTSRSSGRHASPFAAAASHSATRRGFRSSSIARLRSSIAGESSGEAPPARTADALSHASSLTSVAAYSASRGALRNRLRSGPARRVLVTEAVQPKDASTRRASRSHAATTRAGSSPSSFTSRTAPGSRPKTLTPGTRRESIRFATFDLVVRLGGQPHAALVPHEGGVHVEDRLGRAVAVDRQSRLVDRDLGGDRVLGTEVDDLLPRSGHVVPECEHEV